MNALFSTSCPSCGAPVEVYSATAVVVVCQYCQSSLTRTDKQLQDSGKKSAVIEDYSPLQLHTSGQYEGHTFTLIGRLQVSYDRGVWNEWYALFDNGSTAWLAESGANYVFSSEQAPLPSQQKIDFAQLQAGKSSLNYKSTRFIAADVRRAQIIKANAQGELPYPLEQKQSINVADYRNQNQFITLDFSDNPNIPTVYAGHAVQLDKLRCQNLRSPQQILAHTGKLKGQNKSSQCPNCGGSIAWVEGMTTNVICQSCHGNLDLSSEDAKLVQIYQFRQDQEKQFSLKLGQKADIDQIDWHLIGLLKKSELDSADAWQNLRKLSNKSLFAVDYWLEYLLYNPEHGFLWLVESSDGTWARANTLNTWPRLNAVLQPHNERGQLMKKLYDYGGRVDYAAGAFYWQIAPDDISCHSDYGNSQHKLCAEYSSAELTWSSSQQVTTQQVADWFKQPDLAQKMAQQRWLSSQDRPAKLSDQQSPKHNASILLFLAYALFNFPALLMSFSSFFSLMLFAGSSYLIYLLLGKPFHFQQRSRHE